MTSPTQRFARREVQDRLREAVDRGDLNADDMLYMAIITADDRPPSHEVADFLEISPSAVRDRFRRTLKRARRLLGIEPGSSS